MSLSKARYSESKDWKKRFPDGKVDITTLRYNKSWKPIFETLFENKKISLINKRLTEDMDKNLYPYPNYLFNAFLLTSFDDVKVVILGQDPYFNHETYDTIMVPQAMGLSFSVPVDIDIPPSLKNIYGNLLKYKHIPKKPKSGNLENWAKQGCLLLNSALTVLDGASNKNCHRIIWKWFTDEIIKYISDNKEHVVFVFWGSDALEKMKLIDLDKHEAIISSHPSPLSAEKQLKEYPSFNSYDHFGKINKLLIKWKMDNIDWTL